MKFQGLTKQAVEESRRKYGSNSLTQIPPDPLWKKILEGFKDPMIIILCVALIIQVVLFFFGKAEWYEPVGILIAIMIANGVASVSENKQEGKASALKAEEEAKETANEAAEILGAEYVQAIGRKFILYRRAKEDPQIVLPR